MIAKRFTTLQHDGFTIADALVALLLLAPCILGIAALKAERVRKNDSSAEHDRAVLLAGEIAKRITTERLPDYRYETSVGLVCQEELKSNNRERMANNALACWQDKVEKELPNGSGSIGFDSKALPPSYVVTINWSTPIAGTASYVARIPDQPN